MSEGDETRQQREQQARLNIRDLIILQRFLEKGTQNNIFSIEEKYSVDIVHGKLTKLINEVKQNLEKEKQPS